MFQLFINNRKSKPAQQASSWQEKLSCSGWIMQIGEITSLPHFMRRQIMSYPSANALGKEKHFGETTISQNRTLCSCSRRMNFPSKLQYYQLLVLRLWCAAALGALPLQPWLSYCTKRCHKWMVPLTVNRKNLQRVGKCGDAWSWWSSEINLQGNATSPANMRSVLELGLLTDSILPNRSLETVLMFSWKSWIVPSFAEELLWFAGFWCPEVLILSKA